MSDETVSYQSIKKIAEEDPIVAVRFHQWRQGIIRWDEMLFHIIVDKSYALANMQKEYTYLIDTMRTDICPNCHYELLHIPKEQ